MRYTTVILRISFLLAIFGVRQTFAQDTREGKPILKHYLMHGGIQYGFGKTLNHKVTSDFQIPISYYHDLHLYLTLKLKKVGLSAGMQASFSKANKSVLQNEFNKMYATPGNEILYHSEGGFLEVITPYFGLSYSIYQKKKWTLDAYARFGLGIMNYTFSNVQIVSTQSGNEIQRIMFNDLKPVLFFKPSLGLQASRKLTNAISFTCGLGFSSGNPSIDEIQEISYTSSPIYPSRKRNLYLNNSMNSACLSIGFDIKPVNRIYPNEKEYKKNLP